MTFEEFHLFLLDYSGVTSQVAGNRFRKHPLPLGSIFFQPYQSKADPFIRASSLVTGPAVLSFIALECALISVYFAVKSIIDLAAKNNKEAKKSIAASGELLLAMTGALLAAILSPIINLIDLIGGGINSISAKSSAEIPIAAAAI